MFRLDICIHKNGFVAPLKKVTRHSPILVDMSRISEAEVLHNLSKRHCTNLNQKMNVIAHQTKCMNPMSISLNALLNPQKKSGSVSGRKENIMPGISPHHYVVISTGNMHSRFARHVSTMD